MLRIALCLALITPMTVVQANETKLQECRRLCKEALKAADKHIVDLNELIVKKDLLNRHLERQAAESRAALMEELDRRNEWYKNPTFTLGLGILAGIITGVVVAK